jgi:sortase (surface protein transpeptidase)
MSGRVPRRRFEGGVRRHRTAAREPWKAAAILLMAVLGVGGWQPGPAPTGPASDPPHAGSAGAFASERSSEASDAVGMAAAAPSRLRISAIELDAPLVGLGIDGAGALVPPEDFDVPGWYEGGTPPGEIGPAVIAGHVDSYDGPAVFARLHELRPGELVEVARGSQWVRFRVTELAWYPKTRFPTEQVYGPTPDPQLRLITCGGGFDHSRRSYTDNLVVYAVAA